MSLCPQRIRLACLALGVALVVSTACQSSKPKHNLSLPPSTGANAAVSAATTAGPVAPVAGSASTAAAASPTDVATLVSKPQPGATGVLMTGVIALNGLAPPEGSTLYLGLVKSENDSNPRTCIDPENNPVNDVGQFYAQVACTPKSGDMLLYVLIVGDPAARDWHRGVIPLPPDLTDFRINTE